MENPQTSPPTGAIPPKYLFVDAAKEKTSRSGRRNARSFVMKNARRNLKWSTSKHTAKRRKESQSISPTTTGTRTPDLSHTPIFSTPSPPNGPTGAIGTFPKLNGSLLVKQELCKECQYFSCQSGQHFCSNSFSRRAQNPLRSPNNSSFDPFGTMSVKSDQHVQKLLEHCKFSSVVSSNPPDLSS
jgi:hypothetical protein